MFSTPLNTRAIQFSFLEALVSTFWCLLLGIPAGIFLAHFKFRGRRVLLQILTLPFVLPPIVVLLGFIVVYGDGGWINSLWGTISVQATPIISIFDNFNGIVLAHVFYNISVAVQLIIPAWQSLDFDMIDVARSLGASRTKIFFQIILPQIKSTIFSASLLIFLYTFNSFAIVLYLGGVKFQTLEVRIYKLMKVNFQYQAGALLAFAQLLINFILIAIYIRSDQKHKSVNQNTTNPAPFEYRTIKNMFFSKKDRFFLGILYLFFLLLLGFVLLPLIGVIISAFTPSQESFNLFSGFLQLFSSQYIPVLGTSTLRLLGNTLFFACTATVITVVFSLLIHLILRRKYRAQTQYVASQVESTLIIMIVLPMATSSVSLALGLFLQYKTTFLYSEATWILIVCAHILISIPFATRTMMNAYNRINPELITVSSTLGASEWQIFRKIEFPLMKRGILVGALFTFAISVGEFGATLFLARGEFGTLSLAISKLVTTRNMQLPASMATILILFTLICFYLIQKIGDNEFKI